mgnify:CR=1 FL=1
MSAHPPITGDDRTDDHSADSHDADHLGHEGHNHGSMKGYLCLLYTSPSPRDS